NSSFAYKGHTVDVTQVGRELGVRYVLQGSVRKAGKRVRITAKLIEAETGVQLWANRHDSDLADIFAAQDEVTRNIAGAMEPALARGAGERATRMNAQQMQAWDHTLRGTWHFHHYTQPQAAAAQACFERALALDPELADAHAWIGRVALLTGALRFHGEREQPL